MSFLDVRDIHIRLGEFALKGVSLSVEKGDYLTVMGPTGAGKTILLECIVGFHRPESGSIHMDGRDMTDEPPEKRRVGIVYQDYALLPHLNVFKNIEYGLKKVDKDKARRKAKVEEMAECLQIDHLLHRRPTTLSGGEQQRAALARALVVQPRMLLMDEPLSALDPKTRHSIRGLIRRVIDKRDITVLHITHDMDDVWALADKVAILKDGCLVQHDTLHRVLHRPANGFIADFVGAAVFTGRYEADNGDLGAVNLGGLVLSTTDRGPNQGEVRVAIRPENVMVFTERPPQGSTRNVFQAVLEDIRHDGMVSFLHYNAGGVRIPAMVTTNSLRELGFELDRTSYLAIKAANVKIV